MQDKEQEQNMESVWVNDGWKSKEAATATAANHSIENFIHEWNDVWCIIRFAFISNTSGKYFPFLILIYTIKQASGANTESGCTPLWHRKHQTHSVFAIHIYKIRLPMWLVCAFFSPQFFSLLCTLFFLFSFRSFFVQSLVSMPFCLTFFDIITFITMGFHILRT